MRNNTQCSIQTYLICVIRVQFKRMKKKQLKSNENKIYLNKTNAFSYSYSILVYIFYTTQ